MLNSRSSYIVLLCLQVIYFRCIFCEEFICEENTKSLIYENTCTLEGYDISGPSEFSMILPFYDKYYGQRTRSEYIYNLRFNNSKIVYIPHGIFSQLPEVRSLHLNGCNLLELTRYDFISATKLIHINLDNNNLTTLPDSSFIGTNNLTYLDLAYNQIAHINPKAFKSLSNLTALNLSYNRIVTIPKNVFANLIAIAEIDLSHNSIASFVDSFDTENYFTLNFLNLNSNQITNITFDPNVVIKVLTINNNALIAINLNRNDIKTLQANNNKLQNSGLSISECNLTDLSLKNNSLLDFNFVRNMSNLQQLDLSFNMGAGPSIASNTFTKLVNLISLRLESVNLPPFDFEMFAHLELLEELDISYNDLNSINFHMLSLLDNLKRLYINGNSLTNITVTEFEILFPNLIEIDISDNNWQCDQLTDVLRKLRQINIKTTVEPERLVKIERNIRGIRCYENNSDWRNVKKMPMVRVPHINNHTVLNLADLNQIKSQLNLLQQQNQNQKLELTEFSDGLNAIENKTTTEIRKLHNRIELLEMKWSAPNTPSDKLVRVLGHDSGIGSSGDIKFIKIILVMFLLAGICVLALKCYETYFKRTPFWRARFHPSSNTIETNIEGNNF